tara:strand:- start:16570 stop:18474 length:1905 start_codon:yes stop_codon:yes gene_type:complete
LFVEKCKNKWQKNKDLSMCGIAAIYSNEQNILGKVDRIINKINYRGPDDKGSLQLKNNFSVGSCRLSIFDISENGKMPMKDFSNNYTIVYNGEIYNFPELKKKFNLSTKSETDTEVILELYSKIGTECINHFNGIFSFILFDKIKNIAFCCRDRLGVKPFYYYWKNEIFVACSEIKGIHEIIEKNINIEKIHTYLTTSFYDFGENTFYKNIHQLEPATFLLFDLNKKKIKKEKYWNLYSKSEEPISENNVISQISEKIENAFKLQVRSDTEVGVNLSSGIDSKIMLSVLDKINGGQSKILANSYYFEDEEFSEKNQLEDFASFKKWKVNYFKISSEDIINNFDKVYSSQEGPFPGVVTISKQLLIERAYNSNCKVILEAQGGDDIAAGYKYVFSSHLKDLFDKKKFKKLFSEIINFSNVENESFIKIIRGIANSSKGYLNGNISADSSNNYFESLFQKNFLRSYKNDYYQKILDKIENEGIGSNLKKFIFRDIFFCKLQRILKSCDRSSMSNSKELRVPLLDHKIVEYFFSLPENYLINKGNLRYIYRSFAYKNYGIKTSFEKKKYVSDPQTKLLKNELFDWAYETLNSSKNLYLQIYNKNEFFKHLIKFKNDKKFNNSNFLWQALCLNRLIND